MHTLDASSNQHFSLSWARKFTRFFKPSCSLRMRENWKFVLCYPDQVQSTPILQHTGSVPIDNFVLVDRRFSIICLQLWIVVTNAEQFYEIALVSIGQETPSCYKMKHNPRSHCCAVTWGPTSLTQHNVTSIGHLKSAAQTSALALTQLLLSWRTCSRGCCCSPRG